MIRPGTVTVMTVVQPEDRRRLAALAQGQALSRLIREALDQYLAAQGLPPLEAIQRHGGHRATEPTP